MDNFVYKGSILSCHPIFFCCCHQSANIKWFHFPFCHGYNSKLITKNIEINNEVPIFSLYPNPDQNEVYLESTIGIPPSTISVYSINGKLIKQIQTNQEKFQERISLNSIQNGIYLIRIENTKFTEVRKIIISNNR